MRVSHGIAMLLFVALPIGAQAPDGRPHIAKEADLPRISYPVSGTAQELLQMPKAQFLQFAAPVEADIQKIQAQYQIDDHTTLAAMLEAEVNVLVLRGGHDQEALDLIARIRSLEDKPAEKLTADLGTEVFLRARMAGGGASEACPKAEPALYAKTLQGLPWETVAPALRELRMRNQVVSPSFLAGMMDTHIGPALAGQHALLLQDAQYVIHMRGFVETMAPCKAVVLPVLETYMAAHETQKPDIWAAREVTLTDADRLTPVPVAIWDSGIDLQLFSGRLYTDPSPGRNEDPHGIAWDLYDDRTHGPLIPLPAEVQRQYPEQVRLMEGVGDLQNGTDSPAASALRARLAAMSPAETRAFFDTQAIVGAYAHGTHVTGIAARGNPAIRLAYARMTYDSGNPHQPPSEVHSRKSAAAKTESVAWFKAHGIRVVNMSWWDRPSNFEKDLADNGIGKDDAERKAMARHLFGIERDALYAAIQGAPDILFVTIAGNNNVDNAFEECMPSSFVLPNLIVTGAVDQAGEPTGFTSYGGNVAVDANGYAVPSVVPGGATVRDSGTSMAAPQVTNLAAKLLAVDPKLTPPALISLIREGATTSADGKRHLIDPQRSMALLKAKMGGSTQAMVQ